MKRTGFLLALLMFAAMSAMAEDMEVWLKHSSGLIVGCSSENRACLLSTGSSSAKRIENTSIRLEDAED